MLEKHEQIFEENHMENRDLKKYQALLKPYTELRIHENRITRYFFMNGNLVRNEKSTVSGVSARVYHNGFFGFASSPVIDDENVEEVVKKAKENAAFLASKSTTEKQPFTSEAAYEYRDFSTTRNRLTEEDVLNYLKAIDQYIATKYPELISRDLKLLALDMEKDLLTSDGTYSHLLWPRTTLYIDLTAGNSDEPCQLTEIFGGRGHFEDLFFKPEDLNEKIDQLYVELMKKNSGVQPVAGYHEVIIDADLVGMLAHEALGHTVEADLVRNGSIAGEYMNKKVASELITLVDFAHTYNGEILLVPVFIDDEGVVSKDAIIIDKGILRSYLHNRDSVESFSMENTGNARAWEYSDEPLIRMRNTCILPGESTLEEMIASVENGYYFTKTNNGQADSTGEFMFGVTAGYEIVNGKLGNAIKDTTISGRAFDVLSSVTMVSKDMKWECAGMCGKKQPIPVSVGGPAIKCKINVGGK